MHPCYHGRVPRRPHARRRSTDPDAYTADDISQATLAESIEITSGLAPPQHMLAVIDALERTERECIRLIVSMPPGHGKSTTLRHALPWLVARQPDKLILLATYGQELSREGCDESRRVAREAGIPLAKDSADEWRTTTRGGVKATSLTGAITGFRTKLAIIDDPIKGWNVAQIGENRDKAWHAISKDIFTRIRPISDDADSADGSIICVATRWHEDDPSGRLAKLGWDCINLPAIKNENTPNEQALWPEFWSLDRLRRIRDDMIRTDGAAAWAALYQGNPSSDEGSGFGPATRAHMPLAAARELGLHVDSIHADAVSA